MYLLCQRWTEPCDGSVVHTLDITEQEANKLQGVLDWLESHAGDEYGSTLSQWELVPAKRIRGDADHCGIDEVLSMLALESRYNEYDESGSYYGAQHPDLDGR